MDVTPNLDAIAKSGTLYRNVFANQPLCSPSRTTLFTGQFPAKSGVWRNTGGGVGLSPTARTLATECAKAGYSANYIGKWHLAEGANGPVPPQQRGGFLGLWQASNILELTSTPFSGDLYDGDGRPIHFQNEYRADFVTSLANRFLDNVSTHSPFLLVVSYLEPHQQNNVGHMVAPPGYAERYKNPFVPADLKFFPGTWREQLPLYYGCMKRVDECIGEIRAKIAERRLARNTILAFVSDHGCHFMTRNTEYKRSPHDASIKIPLIVDGPGFHGGREVEPMVGMVDVMPTFLQAAGIPIPPTVQGRSTVPLLTGKHESWRNEVFVQLSEYWVGRAIRTPEWTYSLVTPRINGKFEPAKSAPAYTSFQLYDNRSDPHQLVNLAGRAETAAIEVDLRNRLRALMHEAGDVQSELLPCAFPYA